LARVPDEAAIVYFPASLVDPRGFSNRVVGPESAVLAFKIEPKKDGSEES